MGMWRPSPLAMDLRNVGTGLWICICQCAFLLSCLILYMFKIHHNNNIKKKPPGEPLWISNGPSEWYSWFGVQHRCCFCLSCCCSVAHSLLTLCNPMDCSTPGLSVSCISRSLPKFMCIALVMPSSHLTLWCPLLCLPSVFPSIRDFSNVSAVHIKWPKYWSLNFSISPSKEYSGLISIKVDWFDLVAVQGTLRSLLQHHNSKASILRYSVFFTVQLSQLYMTTGKTIALTIQTFAGRVMFLLFNTLFRSVIAFRPRSKRLLISWLQSPPTVILESKRGNLSLFPPFPSLFTMK